MTPSPSETKARRKGVQLLRADDLRKKHGPRILIPDAKRRYAMRFQLEANGHGRHELLTYERSLAGGWKTALRWAKKIESGDLK